jgi:hypothetical protein
MYSSLHLCMVHLTKFQPSSSNELSRRDSCLRTKVKCIFNIVVLFSTVFSN